MEREREPGERERERESPGREREREFFVLTSRPRGAARYPNHRASTKSADIVAVATRIRFSCEFLPLRELNYIIELVFGNASRRTWVGAVCTDRFPDITMGFNGYM